MRGMGKVKHKRRVRHTLLPLDFHFQVKQARLSPHTMSSSLADELLADLDGLSDNDEELAGEDEAGPSTSTPAAGTSGNTNADVDMSDEEPEAGEEEGVGGLVLQDGVKPADELDAEDVQQMELGDIEDVTNVAKLEGSRRMAETLKVSLWFLAYGCTCYSPS
jgi:hypothetical protein